MNSKISKKSKHLFRVLGAYTTQQTVHSVVTQAPGQLPMQPPQQPTPQPQTIPGMCMYYERHENLIEYLSQKMFVL